MRAFYELSLWITLSLYPDFHHGLPSTTVLQEWRSTKRTTRELPEQSPCQGLSKGSNGPGVRPLHAHGASPEDGTGAAFRGRVNPRDRRERRGEKRLPSATRNP